MIITNCEPRVFRYWCYKVLPLVYDDSLSYYEVLCKVTDYINKLIDENKIMAADIEQLKADMAIVKNWIDNFDTNWIKEVVVDYLGEIAKTVWFGISASGYFMAVIPKAWDGIKFGTIQDGDLYGHLTLQYD